MVQRQFYKTREDGVNLYITFSDESLYIKKLTHDRTPRNEVYKYAIDVESANYEYVETDRLIKHTAQQSKEMDDAGVGYWIPSMKIKE